MIHESKFNNNTIDTLTTLKSIVVRYCLKPELMDAHYQSHLLHAVRERYEKKSFKDHGYISKVIDIKRILRQEIMSMVPNNYFILEMNVMTFYPNIGDRISVNIDKIFHHGVFIMEDKIRILIPIALCTDCSVTKDFSSSYLLHHPTGKTFEKNDMILIELVEVRFEKDGFSCIATIVI